MRVNKQYILVRIDKEAQRLKREKTESGLLYIPPNFTFMARNLQYGEILQIGDKAAKNYPYAQVGDTALFHHFIEGSYDDPGIEYLLDIEPNGDELRLIDCTNLNGDYKIFGFIKPDGNLLPAEQFVFVDRMISPFKRKYVSSFLFNTEYEPSEDELRQKLDDLKGRQHALNETLQTTGSVSQAEEIMREIDIINKERGQISRFLDSDKFVSTKVNFINPNTCRELGIDIGDRIVTFDKMLYPLWIKEHRFLVARADYVIGKLKEKELAISE